MRRKMKTLLFSILCFSMVSGYCLPTYASEDNVSQDHETVVEKNQLLQATKNAETEAVEPTSEDLETVPVEEIVPAEENNGGIDLLKTDVFTVVYRLRPVKHSLEKTRFVTKTFTSKDFPEFNDNKIVSGTYVQEDQDYYEHFNAFALEHAPQGYGPTGKGSTGSSVIKESDYSYSFDLMEKFDVEKHEHIFVKYVDETGTPIYGGEQDAVVTNVQGKDITSLKAEAIEMVPLGYAFDDDEFEIQTIDGQRYVNVQVKKAEDNRQFTMIFLEEKGGEFFRIDSKTIKLSDVEVIEDGRSVVKTDDIKRFIKNGYVLRDEFHTQGNVFWDYSINQDKPLIFTNPTAEIVIKKEYAVEDVAGPSVNDDLDIPTVGITVTPDVQAILEDSIVDDTLKTNIKKAISEGKKVTIQVNYDTKNVNKEELALISNYATKNDMKLVQSFDLGISVVTEDGQILGQITETTKPLSFDFSLPETLKKEGRKFYVLREHKGVVDPLNVTEDVFHTFNTNQFSTYAISYTDGTPVVEQETTPQTDESSKEETKPENKKEESVGTATETNGIRFMTYMLMSLSVILLIAGVKKLESGR